MVAEPTRTYPGELPVLALRAVVLPLTIQPLAINRPTSIESVNRALSADRLVFLTLQNTDDEDPGPDDVRSIGTIAAIRQMAKAQAGVHVIVEGLTRARADLVTRSGLSLRSTVTPLPETAERTLEVDAYVRRLQELIDRALSAASGLSQEMRGLIAGIDDPLRLAYVLASLLDIKADEKQRILEHNNLTDKLKAVVDALTREIALLELKGKIESAAQQEMTDAERQYYLRQQLKAIQDELGEGEKTDVQKIRSRLAAAKLPEAVAITANREVDRLARMTPASPEYQMIRTYIDWVLDVPWSTMTEDRLDPSAAREVLDADHYDLDKVKERIVEYLAVHKLKSRQATGASGAGSAAIAGIAGVAIRGPILCFVGPPGVGKTSLGQSIARAMNRKFVRISLGGVRDEAEIRGHRRTYIGAIPGRIVQALKQAGAMNPVFMLDEIDKVSAGFQGDPAAALLEVLDPAQNHAFRDHYLEINIDLSRVLFIATANQLGTVHPALLDRMEILQLSGYSEEEKLHIARRYLNPPPAGRTRPDARRRHDRRRRGAADRVRLHTRGRCSESRAADWRRRPENRRAYRRSPGRRASDARGQGGQPARLSGPRPFPPRSVVPRVAPRRRDRRRVDRDGRRGAVCRSEFAAIRTSRDHPDRPAGQRHAGIRASRRQPHPRPCARAGRPTGFPGPARSSHPRTGGRHSEGRSFRGRHHGHRDRLGASQSTGERRCGDDR